MAAHTGAELVRHMKTEKRLDENSVMMMTAEQNPRHSSESFVRAP